MPRVKLATPPVDKLKATFLERKHALNLSDCDIAPKLGKSRQTLHRMWKEPTTDWKLCDILSMAKILGVTKESLRESI